MAQNRILVIEDDDVLRETMRELLELEGYQVKTACNGREALAQLDQDQANRLVPPCLILLDLMMPVMSGGEFLASLEQAHPEILRATVVVVLTAAAETFGSRLPVRNLQVVQKPMQIDDLLGLAARHCGR